MTRMPTLSRRDWLRLSTAGVVGASMSGWLEVLANVLGFPIHRLADGETGGAFGAARLARLAVTGEDPAAVCTPPHRVETIAPDPALSESYAQALAGWRKLYPGIRGATA